MAWLGGFKGDSYNREEFRAWLRTQKKPSFVSFIAAHATGAPYTLASSGGKQRMLNFAHYYKNQQGWKGGPHFFVMGDGKVYPGTPVNFPTVHSPSWNNIALAVEAEGDYRKGQRDYKTGDGKIVWDAMAWVFEELLEWLGLDISDKYIRFHKEDPRTSHRECPGAMEKSWFIDKVKSTGSATILPVQEPKLPLPTPVIPITTNKKEVVYQAGKATYSEYLVGMMKRVEGLRLVAYRDAPGWAIGYGHNSTGLIEPIPYEGMKLKDEKEADVILRSDLNDKLRYINTWVKVPLTQGNVDALCMYIFQQGPGNFKKKLLPTINNKMHWTTAKLIETQAHVNAGVMRRRRLEADIYRGLQPTKW